MRTRALRLLFVQRTSGGLRVIFVVSDEHVFKCGMKDISGTRSHRWKTIHGEIENNIVHLDPQNTIIEDTRAKSIEMDRGTIHWMVIEMPEMFLWRKNAAGCNQCCNRCVKMIDSRHNERFDTVADELCDRCEEYFGIVAEDDASATEGADGIQPRCVELGY